MPPLPPQRVLEHYPCREGISFNGSLLARVGTLMDSLPVPFCPSLLLAHFWSQADICTSPRRLRGRLRS